MSDWRGLGASKDVTGVAAAGAGPLSGYTDELKAVITETAVREFSAWLERPIEEGGQHPCPGCGVEVSDDTDNYGGHCNTCE